MRGDRTRDQSIKSRTLYQTEIIVECQVKMIRLIPPFSPPVSLANGVTQGRVTLDLLLANSVKSLPSSPRRLRPGLYAPDHKLEQPRADPSVDFPQRLRVMCPSRKILGTTRGSIPG